MKTSELGPFWLRDTARELRAKATRQEQNAYTGALSDVCDRVARHYRKAAVLLDDAATHMEDEFSSPIKVRDSCGYCGCPTGSSDCQRAHP